MADDLPADLAANLDHCIHSDVIGLATNSAVRLIRLPGKESIAATI